MRMNIKQIMAAVKNCDEKRAEAIENHINCECMLDWSECSMPQLNRAAKKAAKVVK